VVAVGKECKAAGIVRLEIDDRRDLYEGMRDCERKVQDMRDDLNKQGDGEEGSKKANIRNLIVPLSKEPLHFGIDQGGI
jgi:hypothetical protein